MTLRTIGAVIVLLVACGKRAEQPEHGEPAGSQRTALAAPKGSASAPMPAGTRTNFAYPPAGPGPHQGFDLAAIHAKLQGTWLAGGAAMSTVPTVWSLDRDTLVQVDQQGTRTTTTMRLLAPCYFVEGAADGSSGTYHDFAFDGETLYLGLGIAGVVNGDRTIGCMSAAMYVLAGSTCTRWTKKPFGKPGNEWDQEPGECGYSADKSKFEADDTKSSRKIYGVETLDVRRGNVLLSRQMEGNKAERFPSLEAALAKQKAQIDALQVLTRTPANLPFKAWGVESVAPAYAANSWVWAAAVTREGTWSLGVSRFEKFEDGAVWVTGGGDAWAPSAFVHPPDAATGMKAGDAALLGIGAMMPYGRFVKLEGDQAIVELKSGSKVEQRSMDATRVWPVKRATWMFGAPVAYKDGERWTAGQLVMDAGVDAFVLTETGVQKLAKTQVRLVDVGKRWTQGTKVWAKQSSGMGPLSFVEGRIEKVHGDGIYFTVKTAGVTFDQTFDRIVDKL